MILIIVICLIACICIVSCEIKVYKYFDPVYQLFRPIINAVDQNVLNYDGCYQETNDIYECGIYQCSFTVVSENAEGAGDEIKLIYDKANQLLKSEQNRKRIEITIDIPRVEYGSYNCVAFFNNYNFVENAGVYDHIYNVYGNEIDADAAMYNSNNDYEINRKEYWDYFSDAEKFSFFQE